MCDAAGDGVRFAPPILRASTLLDLLRKLLVLEHRDRRRLAGEAQFLPARHHLLVGVLRQLGAPGEALVVAEVHARIDQALRAPRTGFRRIEARIEARAPS